MKSDQAKGRALFMKAYEKTQELQQYQTAIKALCMKTLDLNREEVNALEMLFLPLPIFWPLTNDNVWSCLSLYDQIYPMEKGEARPVNGMLFRLSEYTKSGKRNGILNSLDQYLEKVYQEKLRSKVWQHTHPLDVLIELMPFDQQLEFYSFLHVTAKDL